MKTNDLITLFESILPQDLVIKCPENLSEESNAHFLEARRFLLEDAARSYFNLIIRPIIAKQIEMRTEDSLTAFSSDCLYGKTTMEKYISMLEPDDELIEKYRLSGENDYLGLSKDFGLI